MLLGAFMVFYNLCILILLPQNLHITMLLFADYKTRYSFLINGPFWENAITDSEKAPIWQLNHIFFHLMWMINKCMKWQRSHGTVSHFLAHYTVRDEGWNIQVMLLNEDNSRAKLTSHLIAADLLNGLRQHSLSCIWVFTVSIYLDSELEAKWLFWADTKSHAAWHFTDITQRGENWLFLTEKLIQSDSQAVPLLVPLDPLAAPQPLLHPPCHVTWIGNTHSPDWYHFKLILILISSQLRGGLLMSMKRHRTRFSSTQVVGIEPITDLGWACPEETSFYCNSVALQGWIRVTVI